MQPLRRQLKMGIILLSLICLLATGLTIYGLGGLNPAQIQQLLHSAGIFAPLLFIVLYAIATLLVLPSTALNLMGGGLFGPWWGTCWASVAAILAAVLAFGFSRTIGRERVARRLGQRWQEMDTQVQRGGLFYMFAIRLIPIMPYGLVNFAAGLTSVSFRDFLLGTSLGTVPSVLPFVLLGSSSVKAVKTGNLWPLMAALALTGTLVIVSTYLRNHPWKREG